MILKICKELCKQYNQYRQNNQYEHYRQCNQYK